MRKRLILFCLLGLCFAYIPRARAQETEIAQLVLNIEKLRQFRSILKQMKQGYEILTGGYNTVINIAKGLPGRAAASEPCGKGLQTGG